MGKSISFELFGFPVTIHGSFLLVVGLLGYVSFSPPELDLTLAFAAIALVAVLVHELGHAFAARSQGVVGTPLISLEGMAGLTRYRLADDPSRLQSIFISVAGPLAGIALGFVILAVRSADVIDETSTVRTLFRIGLFTTFGWSAFNLLPIVPLDGGHIMTDMLPGSPLVRRRRAAMVSIAFAVAAGAALWWYYDSLFGPLILGMMAAQNMSLLSASKNASAIAPPLTPRQE